MLSMVPTLSKFPGASPRTGEAKILVPSSKGKGSSTFPGLMRRLISVHRARRSRNVPWSLEVLCRPQWIPLARAGRSQRNDSKIPLKYHKFAVDSHLVITLGCYITLELLEWFAAFAQLSGTQPIERMEVTKRPELRTASSDTCIYQRPEVPPWERPKKERM